MTQPTETAPADTAPAEPITAALEPEPLLTEPELQGDSTEPEPESFPRDVVAKLRKENAGHRERAREATERADALAAELWHERVAALGLLADPADLPLDPDRLTDPAAIRAAAEELLTEKPHLRSRRITTRAGQGESNASGSVSLAGLLRRNA